MEWEKVLLSYSICEYVLSYILTIAHVFLYSFFLSNSSVIDPIMHSIRPLLLSLGLQEQLIFFNTQSWPKHWHVLYQTDSLFFFNNVVTWAFYYCNTHLQHFYNFSMCCITSPLFIHKAVFLKQECVFFANTFANTLIFSPYNQRNLPLPCMFSFTYLKL